MGNLVMEERKLAPVTDALMNHLHALELAGVPLHQILAIGEQKGLTVQNLVQWTGKFLVRNAQVDSPEEAEVLVFTSIRRWKELVPAILRQLTSRRNAIMVAEPGCLQCWSVLAKHHFVPSRFGRPMLRRLGYPKCLAGSPTASISTGGDLTEVMNWLGSGRTLVGHDVSMSGFKTNSPKWGRIECDSLTLLEGEGPALVDWEPGDWGYPSGLAPTLRIEHVRGLKNLTGFRLGRVALEDCPDLESVDGSYWELKAKDCPRLASAWLRPSTSKLFLKGCSGLRSIQLGRADLGLCTPSEDPMDYPVEEIVIQECRNLRNLPTCLNVTGGLHLDQVGPIENWPWDFHVGGTFLISDCPNLDTLPPVVVQGSLVVTGKSGLRRISPGTVVAKHLDLRACDQLEDIPRGVKVGGVMFLPEHLSHRRGACELQLVDAPVLIESPEPDLYEELRFLLKALRFRDLIPPSERTDALEQAEGILHNLQARLGVEPKLESMLLWTASEVWRDLSEEDWAARCPWAFDQNESDEDLPMAWFLSLVRE